jgi:hypothetical protein
MFNVFKEAARSRPIRWTETNHSKATSGLTNYTNTPIHIVSLATPTGLNRGAAPKHPRSPSRFDFLALGKASWATTTARFGVG